MIVVEFAEHGNLLRHLRDRRQQNYEDMNEYSLDITSAERVRIACDVAGRNETSCNDEGTSAVLFEKRSLITA